MSLRGRRTDWADKIERDVNHRGARLEPEVCEKRDRIRHVLDDVHDQHEVEGLRIVGRVAEHE